MRKFFAALALLTAAVISVPALHGQDSTGSASLTGKWHFVIDTGSDNREFDADFSVADGKVTGTFDKDEVKGTVEGEKFKLEFPHNSDEVGKGVLKIDGKIAADQLSGSWSFQTYDGSFKATRPKPKAD